MLRSTPTRATGAVALVAASYGLGFRPWRRRWLASPDESARGLPGDALVPDADFNQTMLDPVGTGNTRLVERFRTRAAPGPPTAIARPMLDVGHFLMTRRHLLGIKERAEQTGEGVTATTLPKVSRTEPELLTIVPVGAR